MKKIIDRLRRGRAGHIFRQTRDRILYVLCVPLFLICIPAILVVRIVRPWAVIRFGFLFSPRIGHFAANTEIYLCERDAGLWHKGPRTVDLFYFQRSVCNRQLARMWKRLLPVSSLIYYLHQANRWIPGWRHHDISLHKIYDSHALIYKTKPHLRFTAEEESRGYSALRRMGIPGDGAFVCFHSRDTAYLDTVYPTTYWTYHDHRNSDIKTYLPAMERLAAGGYYAVRMGAVVEDPIKTGNGRIIDYASGYRSDFMDIFLPSRCRFFLGSTAGYLEVPRIFRTPIAYVNFLPVGYMHTASPSDLYIFKKLWLRKEKRLMTFREIFGSGAASFLYTSDYEKNGIEVIDNTAGEISDLATEMDARLDKRWTPAPEDDELQARFWKVFRSYQPNGVSLARVGAQFLRDNRGLLDQ
ncbi:MAG: TIGR04372 family glycosyltransferase [Candidatus Omnitrophota bacterium]